MKIKDQRNESLINYILVVLAGILQKGDEKSDGSNATLGSEEQEAPTKYALGNRALAILLLSESKDEPESVVRRKGKEFLKFDFLESTRKLVDVLACLRSRVIEGYKIPLQKTSFELPSLPLSDEQILSAFQFLIRLTPQEIEKLQLPSHVQHPLLQKAFINLASYRGNDILDRIINVYKTSIQLFSEKLDTPIGRDEITKYIESHVESDQQIKKIEIAIDRLLLQAGVGQARYLEISGPNKYIKNYLTPKFIDKFISTVTRNNEISKRFPIYLKRISIEPMSPFSLATRDKKVEGSPILSNILLFNKSEKNEKFILPVDSTFDQLTSITVYKIIGYFDIHFTLNELDNYKEKFNSIYIDKIRDKIAVKNGEQEKICFSVESTGIGGIISHITKIINNTLLNDISCLRREFFPIAHDIYVEKKIINDKVSSPVITHNFVNLCRNSTLEKAMNYSCKEKRVLSYEEFNFSDPQGVGDYCHFDAVLSTSRSALQSRLEALSNTRIDSEVYINDLLGRVWQANVFHEAKELMDGYPFSSFALENKLQSELHGEEYEDSYIFCKSHLTIIEAFLGEGSYRRAYIYLEKVKDKLHEMSALGIRWLQEYNLALKEDKESEEIPDNIYEVYSGSLLAQYEICLAQYFYMLDWRSESSHEQYQYFLGLIEEENISQQSVTRESWKALERAEKHLTVRIIKYHIINEVSQAAFHPYYSLLSKIYFLRAKLFIWFSKLVPPDGSEFSLPMYNETTDHNLSQNFCKARLFLLERSRVYAACDGQNELYVIRTVYQCWNWLMIRFFVNENSDDWKIGDLSITEYDCLEWAKQLRNNSLLQYAEIGRKCYFATKEKSGISQPLANKYESLINYDIDPIPVIKEITGIDNQLGYTKLSYEKDGYEEETEVLFLNMDYMALKRGLIDPNNLKSTQSIYLFGPKACYLFFIRGLYHLCSNSCTEFENDSINRINFRKLTPEMWDEKLAHSYRLFSYAWAIADDGCILKKSKEDENSWVVKRYGYEKNKLYEDSHAESVSGLFPLRLTEIADLGKIFAAVCAALRCHTSVKEVREEEIRLLLKHLYGKPDVGVADAFRYALLDQKLYNNHLSKHFQQYIDLIRKTAVKTTPKNMKGIVDMRNDLLRDIFMYQS